jgi:hypothetical protein
MSLPSKFPENWGQNRCKQLITSMMSSLGLFRRFLDHPIDNKGLSCVGFVWVCLPKLGTGNSKLETRNSKFETRGPPRRSLHVRLRLPCPLSTVYRLLLSTFHRMRPILAFFYARAVPPIQQSPHYVVSAEFRISSFEFPVSNRLGVCTFLAKFIISWSAKLVNSFVIARF